MSSRILLLGGTGMMGRPVVRCLKERGHTLRIFTRNMRKAQNMFGDTVEIVEGSALNRDDIRTALEGSDAVHINLSPATEYAAMGQVIDLAGVQLDRISYVSAITLSEENRWFDRVDMKMRTEELLQNSGIPHVIFRPTWVMETLRNFIRGKRAVVIVGKNPPALHFFAAADFGRMVAASYEDDRGFGKRLYVYGPEAVTLGDAMKRFAAACYPEAKVIHLSLWQARLAAWLMRNKSLAEVTKLIAYLDVAGEHGDCSEANALYGAPAITLD
ncbi:MAG: SDR family oxidoreductase, partial [Bythopirellula sp.]